MKLADKIALQTKTVEKYINAIEQEMKNYQYYRMAQAETNRARAKWKKSLEYLHILQSE